MSPLLMGLFYQHKTTPCSPRPCKGSFSALLSPQPMARVSAPGFAVSSSPDFSCVQCEQICDLAVPPALMASFGLGSVLSLVSRSDPVNCPCPGRLVIPWLWVPTLRFFCLGWLCLLSSQTWGCRRPRGSARPASRSPMCPVPRGVSRQLHSGCPGLSHHHLSPGSSPGSPGPHSPRTPPPFSTSHERLFNPKSGRLTLLRVSRGLPSDGGLRGSRGWGSSGPGAWTTLNPVSSRSPLCILQLAFP